MQIEITYKNKQKIKLKKYTTTFKTTTIQFIET